MSICPKNKSSKARRDKRKLENERSQFGKMQQVRRINDATQSLPCMRKLQQERDYQNGRSIKHAACRSWGVCLRTLFVL